MGLPREAGWGGAEVEEMWIEVGGEIPLVAKEIVTSSAIAVALVKGGVIASLIALGHQCLTP